MKLFLVMAGILLLSSIALAEEITGNLTIGTHENTTLVFIVTEAPRTNTGYNIEISPSSQNVTLNSSFDFNLTVYDAFDQLETNFTESNLTSWIYQYDTEKTYMLKNGTIDRLSMTQDGQKYNVTVSALNNFIGGEFRTYFKIKDNLNITGQNYTNIVINESYIDFWWTDAPEYLSPGEKDTWQFRIKNYGNKTAENISITSTVQSCLEIDTTTISPSQSTTSRSATEVSFNKSLVPDATETFSFSVSAASLEENCTYTVKIENGKFWSNGTFATTKTISDSIAIRNLSTEENVTSNITGTGENFTFSYVPEKISLTEGENIEFFAALNTTDNFTVENVSLSLSLNASLYNINPSQLNVSPNETSFSVVNITLPARYNLGSEAVTIYAEKGETQKTKVFEMEVSPSASRIQEIIDKYYVYLQEIAGYKSKAKTLGEQGKDTENLWFYIDSMDEKLTAIKGYIDNEKYIKAYYAEGTIEDLKKAIEQEIERLESQPISLSLEWIIVIAVVVVIVFLAYLLWPVKQESSTMQLFKLRKRKKEGFANKIKRELSKLWKRKQA